MVVVPSYTLLMVGAGVMDLTATVSEPTTLMVLLKLAPLDTAMLEALHWYAPTLSQPEVL